MLAGRAGTGHASDLSEPRERSSGVVDHVLMVLNKHDLAGVEPGTEAA